MHNIWGTFRCNDGIQEDLGITQKNVIWRRNSGSPLSLICWAKPYQTDKQQVTIPLPQLGV